MYFVFFSCKQAYLQRETPKGVIHLKDIVQVYQSTKRREHLIKHVFTLETRSRTFLIQAPSIITMELWVACLKLPVSTLMLEPPSQVLQLELLTQSYASYQSIQFFSLHQNELTCFQSLILMFVFVYVVAVFMSVSIARCCQSTA